MFFNLSKDTHDWIQDKRTGKEYLVLETTRSFSSDKTRCEDRGGYLTQPKNHYENAFVDSLTEGSFFLGMTRNDDTEQIWMWETDDGTAAAVEWTNWAPVNEIPDGKRCSSVVADVNDVTPGTWFKRFCELNAFVDSLVCERDSGKC